MGGTTGVEMGLQREGSARCTKASKLYLTIKKVTKGCTQGSNTIKCALLKVHASGEVEEF